MTSSSRRAASLADRVAHALARALDAPLSRRDPFARADAIVILGAPLPRPADLGRVLPDGALGHVLEERVRAGVELWRRGGARLLCVTGGGPPGRVEAHAMAARALALGVDPAVLRVEPRARSTAENARFSAALLRAEGCRTAWVVSQPFHLRRALYLFRRRGITPLAWHAEDSVQYRAPRRALRWLGREYAALAHLAVTETARAAGRARGPR